MTPTAGQVKSAYLKQVRAGLTERGLRRATEDRYDREAGDVTDNLLLRLRAAGRGETKVDVITLGAGVTVSWAEQEAAALRGTDANPERTTLVVDLLQRRGGTSSDPLEATTTDEAEESAGELLRLVDEVAEPWWQSHADPATVLDEMWASNAYRELDPLETMASIARRLGRDDLCRQILDAHQADLDRRGADHAAFAPNRQWRQAFEELLRSGRTPD
jgi:hypothetical protein